MKKSITVVVCLLGIAAIYLFAQAGDLEPPGPPAPTMVTLQQIYDRVSASPVGVAKTGQTECYGAGGTVIPCSGSGQDGEYQMGVSVNPRFTDNDDGTVIDNLTGLIWLQNADCFGKLPWSDALTQVNTLASGSCGLADGSSSGDWRLSNVTELQGLTDYGEHYPALPPGHPFSVVLFSVAPDDCWSSTSVVRTPETAWSVGLCCGGDVNRLDKTGSLYVWPVRGRL